MRRRRRVALKLRRAAAAAANRRRAGRGEVTSTITAWWEGRRWMMPRSVEKPIFESAAGVFLNGMGSLSPGF